LDLFLKLIPKQKKQKNRGSKPQARDAGTLALVANDGLKEFLLSQVSLKQRLKRPREALL
jgi:hypothetical protein